MCQGKRRSGSRGEEEYNGIHRDGPEEAQVDLTDATLVDNQESLTRQAVVAPSSSFDKICSTGRE